MLSDEAAASPDASSAIWQAWYNHVRHTRLTPVAYACLRRTVEGSELSVQLRRWEIRTSPPY
jgi:hypothetical protein